MFIVACTCDLNVVLSRCARYFVSVCFTLCIFVFQKRKKKFRVLWFEVRSVGEPYSQLCFSYHERGQRCHCCFFLEIMLHFHYSKSFLIV